MRRRVWSVVEIEGMMRAVYEGNGMTVAACPEASGALQHYEAGFRAALVALAIALGLVSEAPRADAPMHASLFSTVGD